MITIKPYGGLGNRLRSIDSAMELASCTGKRLNLIWDANRELNSSFSSLFEVPDELILKEVSTYYVPRKMNEKFSSLMHKIKINYPFSYDCILHEEDILRYKHVDFNFCELSSFENIYLYVNGRFLLPEKPFSYLKPVMSVNNILKEITAQFTAKTIGVHIRRTDNKLSIEKSPLGNFIELMKTEVDNDNNVRFFLSTDSPEDEDYIQNQFPGRIIVYKKELRRDKAEGVRDALIDLIALSKTNSIIGSFYSSFSEVAAEMGNISLTIAGK